MVEEQPSPLRRTLGDYVMQHGPKHFSSTTISTTTKALKMKLALICLISTHQFTSTDHKDPYTHLSTFYELVDKMGFR